MSWSYTLGPYASQQATPTAAGRRNQVRYYLGDVDQSRQLIQDEELDLALTLSGNGLAATTIEAARHVLARFAHKPDVETKADGSTVDWRGVRERMEALIRERILAAAPMPVVGGVGRDAIETQDEDTDNLTPRFGGAEPGGPIADDDRDLHIPADLRGLA